MKKSTRINELLGAKKFQKCVFALEKFKYIIIDKLFPDIIEEKYEKRLSKALDKALKNEPEEEKRKQLLKNYHDKVLISRREINNKMNRNYHMRKDNSMEFIKYLNSNKKIHMKGLIANGLTYLIVIPLLASGIVAPIVGGIVLGINALHTVINFECINLQNYNIKRFENHREKLEQLRIKREKQELEKYKNIIGVVSNKLNGQREIPKVEEVAKEITTKEQLEEMKNLLLSYILSQGKEKTLRKGERKCQQ